jgi:oligosaccharide repeat unit polymerase
MSPIDYLFLYLQIFSLLIVVAKELSKNKHRNLYLILVSLTFLVLVQFQTFWIFGKMGNSLQIIHIFQAISIDGARLANIYMFFGICIFLSTILVSSNSKSRPGFKNYSELNSPTIAHLACKAPSLLTYGIVASSVILFTIAIVILLGGLATALSTPGQSIGGQTMLLILIGIGKYPLITKLASYQKIAIFDICLYFMAICVALLNSRFTAAAYIVQVLFAVHYCRKEIPVKNMIYSVFSLVFIFIVFGIYREFGNFRSSTDFNLDEFLDFALTRFGGDDSIIDWFYGFGVESFAGLAGIITFDIRQHGMAHDLGISELSFITQLIPNQLRNDVTLPFIYISDFIKSSYPYPDASIVKPGYENVYAHFGVFGVPMLSYLIGILTYKLNELMFDKSKSSEIKLLISLLSVYILMLIQNSISAVLFFGIGEAFMFKVYMILLDNTGTSDRTADQQTS